MVKIAILANNCGCEERETWFKQFMKEKLIPYKEYELLSYPDQDINEIVESKKIKADYVFVVFDAIRGMNGNFAHVVRNLHYQEIQPILIVTNCDKTGSDLDEANKALFSIWWDEENRVVEPDSITSNNLYFSYEKKAFSTSPHVTKKNDISDLIERIS